MDDYIANMDSLNAVDRYFSTEPEPETVAGLRKTMYDFVQYHVQAKRKVAFVTSGGTMIPLEKNTVRFLDNFSTGTRGSRSAECFIAQGYAVLFVHRHRSLQPYVHPYQQQHLFDTILDVVDGNIEVMTNETTSNLASAIQQRKQALDAKLLLEIPFTTVNDYVYLLRAGAEAIAECKERAVAYLAAAVSDYYAPSSSMATHKIQSGSGELTLTLQPVPKMLVPLVSTWCQNAFVVTFKLETDEELLTKKALGALRTYKHQLVVANLLHTRTTTVTMIGADESSKVVQLTPTRSLEQAIVAEIDVRHNALIALKHALNVM